MIWFLNTPPRVICNKLLLNHSPAISVRNRFSISGPVFGSCRPYPGKRLIVLDSPVSWCGSFQRSTHPPMCLHNRFRSFFAQLFNEFHYFGYNDPVPIEKIFTICLEVSAETCTRRHTCTPSAGKPWPGHPVGSWEGDQDRKLIIPTKPRVSLRWAPPPVDRGEGEMDGSLFLSIMLSM